MKVLTVKTGVWEARVPAPSPHSGPEPKLKAASRGPRLCSHKILGPARVCAWGVRAPGGVEKEMTTHSSILTWDISWTDDSGRLQSMGTQLSVCTHTHTLSSFSSTTEESINTGL